MIRAVLIDDEPDSIFILKELLRTHCPEVRVVGEADGIPAALEEIDRTLPDLLFLDINLADSDGFELLDRLQSRELRVIFVTAHDDQALRAFRYSAIDYLLKPVDGADLRRAVDKLTERRREDGGNNHLDILLENIRALQASDQKIAIPMLTGLIFIFPRDIVRCESTGNYTNIIMSDGSSLLSSRPIGDYEDLLPDNLFMRVHNSHIVNLNRIQKYERGRGGYIVMEDDSVVEVAIRRREEFLKRVLKQRI